MLKSEIIKKVEKEFAEKQSQVNSAKRNAFAENMKNPEFAKLEKEIRNLNIQIAEKEIENEDVNSLNLALEELTNKQKQIEKPYLVNYECEKCKDKGIVDGKYCSCFNKRVNELVVAESGVSIETLRHFADCDFSKFNRPEEAKKIYMLFEEILKSLSKTKYKNFLIQGDSGVGKTFLLSTIAGEAIDLGYSLFFVTAFNLNQLMLKYHTNFERDREKYLSPALESDILIIDDLGTEQILKNVTKEYLLTILKERVLAGKHTFISTNLSLGELNDRYGERIFSRIVDKAHSVALKLDNDNLRLKR